MKNEKWKEVRQQLQENVRKKIVGGFGNYCWVSGCKSEIYDKNRKKTKREDLRKKWLNLLKHVRRKEGADSCHVKNPNKRICVCKVHFKNEDPTTSLVRGKKKVTPG